MPAGFLGHEGLIAGVRTYLRKLVLAWKDTLKVSPQSIGAEVIGLPGIIGVSARVLEQSNNKMRSDSRIFKISIQILEDSTWQTLLPFIACKASFGTRTMTPTKP